MADKIQSEQEELINTITHGLGILFAAIASPFLLAYVNNSGTDGNFWAVAIFCFGMLTVYTSSTLYHAVREKKLKYKLRIWDHISIFFLIGGSYTAIVQRYVNAETATTFLITMWSIIAAGSLLKIFFTGKFSKLELMLYVGLGWMAFFIFKPLSQTMPLDVFWWLLAGGLFYMSGVFFYARKKMLYNHGVWHCFVLGGTISHFVAVWKSF
jgi:hemolysin III